MKKGTNDVYLKFLPLQIISKTSKSIWIKHIYCRSLEEWKEKMTRGSGDKVQRERKLEDWYEYNKRCVLIDE